MRKLKMLSVGIGIILLVNLAGSISVTVLADEFSKGASCLSGNANPIAYAISPRAKIALAENGFVVIPSNEFKDVAEVYEDFKRKGVPIFVTTDAILHITHVLLDYTWRIVEIEKIRPALIELSQALLEESLHQYKEAKYPNIKEAALKNVMFFSVAIRLLDRSKPIPELVKDEVKAEIELIDEHKGWASSPIFEDHQSQYLYQEDYSQYIPRGHYTRNEEFKSFFKAMMWYGRMLFPLPRKGWYIDRFLMRITRQALLITYALIQNEKAFEIWENVYQSISFFIGKSDDLTFYDYKNLMEKIYGSRPSLKHFESDEKVKNFILQAVKLREPKIESGIKWTRMLRSDAFYRKGFKFLGQRYIPDSYIFQQLVYPKVEERFLPKGLDVMAVIGSKVAKDILRKESDFSRKGYENQLKKLEEEFLQMNEGEWTKSMYLMWLYSLQPLLKEKEEPYPLFMRNKNWLKKTLNTALASWAELRHDTVLYVKQAYTPPKGLAPLIKGYVEPYPLLYRRVGKLIQNTQDNLSSRNLLIPECEKKLEDFEKLLIQLEVVSQKELEEKSLNLQEYQLIWNIGSTLSSFTHFSEPIMEKIVSATDSKMMAISDVHTDANTGRVLEEAVGYPFILYVMAPIEGKLTLTRGAVFSYYEFAQPMDKRLTDQEWQEMLEAGKEPALPKWTESFMVKNKQKSSIEKESTVILKFETIEKGFFSGFTERKNWVIRTQEQWMELWGTHTSIRIPHPTPPPVDFGKEMILAVFTGQKPSGGFAVEITRVEKYENELVASFIEVRPPPDALVTQVLTQPYHIIKMKKSDLPVRFKKIKEKKK